MKCCRIIRDMSAKSGDWYFYDKQFRYIRQSAPDLYPWVVYSLATMATRGLEFSPQTTIPRAAGRIVSPFNAPPFLLFRCPPLGIVPKWDPSEFRLQKDRGWLFHGEN